MNIRVLKPILMGCAVFPIAGLGFFFLWFSTDPTEMTNDFGAMFVGGDNHNFSDGTCNIDPQQGDCVFNVECS